MGDWIYVLGGGIVLFWAGAWLLLHLGNFEMRISHLRQGIENRMSQLERQQQNHNRTVADYERTTQTIFSQLADVTDNLEKTRQELADVKRSINVMEISVNDLKLRSMPPRSMRYG